MKDPRDLTLSEWLNAIKACEIGNYNDPKNAPDPKLPFLEFMREVERRENQPIDRRKPQS